ncbi:MAG: MOSC domain-containing protein [Rhizobiaceae bacterium]
MKIVPAKKLNGKVTRVLRADGDDFVTKDVDKLILGYGGIKGDFHEGLTRASGAREPWYRRETEMRNERQISILSEEELAEIAPAMGLDAVDAGWIGANLVFEGVANMSYLPPRTLILFDSGVTLRIDGYNAPCRCAGGSIARHVANEAEDHAQTDLALQFKDAAHMKRGLVAWVEREGEIHTGDTFTARIWPQWIYE